MDTVQQPVHSLQEPEDGKAWGATVMGTGSEQAAIR
jgi:hypothetical protein